MGEVFTGRYELVDLLGAGGMGAVWRVWDHRDATYRAAKVLRQSDSVSLLRFVRESSWRVEHPHVLMPQGRAGEDERVLFTMPVVRGGSLETVIADHGTVDPAWAAIVVDQVLQALAAVHANGIVHRDVKPANILLEPTGSHRPHAWLSDFGIAVSAEDARLTRAHEVVGTRRYQPPEAAAGAEPAPAQDLYAVGLVLRETVGDRPESAALVERLCGPAQDRPSAVEARAGLAAIAWDRSDVEELVEVFEQLPELPDGWAADGPRAGARHAPLRPAAPPQVASPRTPPAPAPPARAGARRAGRRIRPELALAAVLALGGVALLVGAVLAL